MSILSPGSFGLRGLSTGGIGANGGMTPQFGSPMGQQGQMPYAGQALGMPPGQMQEYGNANSGTVPYSQLPNSNPQGRGMPGGIGQTRGVPGLRQNTGGYNNRAGIPGMPGIMPPRGAPGMSSYGALGANAGGNPAMGMLGSGGAPPPMIQKVPVGLQGPGAPPQSGGMPQTNALQQNTGSNNGAPQWNNTPGQGGFAQQNAGSINAGNGNDPSTWQVQSGNGGMVGLGQAMGQGYQPNWASLGMPQMQGWQPGQPMPQSPQSQGPGQPGYTGAPPSGNSSMGPQQQQWWQQPQMQGGQQQPQDQGQQTMNAPPQYRPPMFQGGPQLRQ